MNGRLRTPGIDRAASMVAVLAPGRCSAPCWSGRRRAHRDDLTGGDPTAYLKKQLVNVCIGLVLMVVVMATDHRWVRIVAPAGLPRLDRSAWCWC